MAYIMDSADVARTCSISRTAADLYIKLQKILYSSIKGGVKDRRGYYVYASQKTLAEKIGRSERTVSRAIKELKDAGLIQVRRTRHNGHIYLDLDGVSGYDKNGGSNISPKSNNYYESIYLNKVHQKQEELAKKMATAQRISSQPSAVVQDLPRENSKNGYTSPKGRPTPKRPRITKEAKAQKRAEYRAFLAKRLELDKPMSYLMDGLGNEFDSYNALADMIADAASSEKAKIAIGGRYITGAEYWEVVKNIELQGLYELLQRIEDADITTGIRNTRAYTLAAVYNEVMFRRLTSASRAG